MQLARAAAARALEALEHPEPTQPRQEPAQQPPGPNLAFTRLARVVNQSVELAEKIAANAFARPTPLTHHAWPQAPNPQTYPGLDGLDLDEGPEHEYCEMDRDNLIEATCRLTATHPNHPERHQAIPEIVEDILTRHPADHASVNFQRVCAVLDILPDRFGLPPHLESQLRPQLE